MDDELYHQAASEFGSSLERLARSYEADLESRRDLLQEIHLALWRSLATFRGQCSLRTWVYRIAHNISVSHVLQGRRASSRVLIGIEELDDLPGSIDGAAAYARQDLLERIVATAQQLKPPDREILLLYLEGVDATTIGEITGISAGNVATKIHRIKKILITRFAKGADDGKRQRR